MEKQKWLRLDGDNGWQIIVPDTDIKPHGFPKGKNKVELAGKFCPCEPKIYEKDKIIIHNSFQDKERIEEAMNNPKTQ